MSDDWQHVGEQVESRRTELGHTQETLVGHINEMVGRKVISTSTLRLIENARQETYRPITLRSLERGLRWKPNSIDRLLEGEAPDTSWEIPTSNLRVISRDYNSTIPHLSPAAQEYIDSIIEREIRKQES